MIKTIVAMSVVVFAVSTQAAPANLFKKYDKNKDGKVTKDEYMATALVEAKNYQVKTKGRTPEQFEKMKSGIIKYRESEFVKRDVNKDGVLTSAEFQAKITK